MTSVTNIGNKQLIIIELNDKNMHIAFYFIYNYIEFLLFALLRPAQLQIDIIKLYNDLNT